MKILIVDDDDIARLSLGAILGATDQATDGEQAWEMLAGGLRPDVCCCDLSMPRLDGLGLVRRARAHPVLHDLPFILVSAASDRRTVESAVELGVAGYIVKPFNAQQTRAVVQRVLRTRRADAESVQETRTRLEVSAAQLALMLSRLCDDVDACSHSLDDESSARHALQRLHGGTLVLGLWRGSTLIKNLLARPHEPAGSRLVLTELKLLAQRKLDALGLPAGTGARGGTPWNQ
jgi:two-component system chemotaxis response regulator CheY